MAMPRRDVLRGGAALALAGALPKGEDQRPNVLLIIADQHRHDASGFAGAAHASTPNLDALASASTRFSDAYCQVPLCVPSRQSLLTGRYGSSHGSFRNRHADVNGERTFAHDFQDAGYFTGWIGKTHCNTQGFASTVSQDDLLTAYRAQEPEAFMASAPMGDRASSIPTLDPMNPGCQRAGQGPVFRMEEHVVERSGEWLKEAPKSKPYLLVASFLNPHPPLFPPDEFLAMYRDAELPHASAFAERNARPFTDLQRRRRISRWRSLPDSTVLGITRAYFASVAWMDACVGKLLDQLDGMAQQRETLVVYTSDHGEMLGEHGLWQKRALYEGATRVPLILRWPGKLAAGKKRTEVVEHLDLTRTLYDLCGVPCRLESSGRSFAPLLLGREQDWKNRARIELTSTISLPKGTELKSGGDKPPAGYWALRMDHWKYIEHSSEERGLYDLASDPGELVNLVQQPKYVDLVQAMRSELLDANPDRWSFHRGKGQTGEGR